MSKFDWVVFMFVKCNVCLVFVYLFEVFSDLLVVVVCLIEIFEVNIVFLCKYF